METKPGFKYVLHQKIKYEILAIEQQDFVT